MISSAPARRPRPFTGRHITVILVAFFGVVAAVNFTMAYIAVSGFGGTVVDNSYVASQNYNRWLAAGRAQAALGWRVTVARDGAGRVAATVADANGGWDGTLTGTARRAMGSNPEQSLNFIALGAGRYRSAAAVPAGRIALRLRLRQGDAVMHSLAELP
jgi:nitrogen fixation protein FixH